jgi:tetratricopeptide (TPR) repeat protein
MRAISMARKPRRFAKPAVAVWTLVIFLQFSPPAHAQDDLRISQQPTVVQNPYAVDAPEPTAAPPRGSVGYQNPFAAAPMQPPTALPIRPGPISRWQRGSLMPPSPSPVIDAILSAAPNVPGGSQTTETVGRAAVNWEHLPPVDDLRAMQVAAAALNRAAAAARTAGSADQAQLESLWPNQPASLLPGEMSSDGTSTFDPLEASGGAAAGSSHRPDGARPTIELTSAIALDSVDTAEGWYASAESAAQEAQSLDDYTAVAQFCERGLRIGPSPEVALPLRQLAAWAYNRRGEARADAGNPRQALADFQMAIGMDADCSLAIHNRGVTFAQQNKPADALRDFNRVIDLNPGLAVAYRNRAELLVSLGRMDEAVRDYDQAIDLSSQDSALFRARGYAWQRLGKHDRALADLNQALRLSPTDAATFAQRGNLAAERGDYSQAVRDFRRAIEFDSHSAEAYRGLAWLLATCPDAEIADALQALAAAKKGAELAPADDCFMADALAAAYARAGEFDEAVRVARHAVSVAPPDMAESLQARLKLYEQGRPYLGRPVSAVLPASHNMHR